jgi:Transmembrane amino acid transporter protein
VRDAHAGVLQPQLRVKRAEEEQPEEQHARHDDRILDRRDVLCGTENTSKKKKLCVNWLTFFLFFPPPPSFPENNQIVGAGGYLGFGMNGKQVSQNILQQLSQTNIGAMIARAFVVVQLFSVYPLLLFIIRIQLFGTFFKSQYPGFLPVLLLNLVVAAISTLFAIYYPHIGDVLRYTGAICGLLFVFVLPISVHWHYQRQKEEFTLRSKIMNGALIILGLGLVVTQFV